jgi:signal transduction histidine kinase
MKFRTRVILVVVASSVIPLALVGLWLTNSAVRSGDQFLQDRLDGALEATVSLVGTRWIQLRSDLLFFGEDAGVQQALQASPGAAQPLDLRDLEQRFRDLDSGVLRLEIRTLAAEPVWTFGSRDAQAGSGSRTATALGYDAIWQELPIYGKISGERIGVLQVAMAPSAFLPPQQLPAITAGMVVALEGPDGRVPTAAPFDASVLAAERFEWAGDEWVTARHRLNSPALSVVIAATLGPFMGSFEETARRGALVLLAVAILALLATVLLTSRLTRSLRDLAEAAVAVAEGDLDRTVPGTTRDEVGAVGNAFNSMTKKLRRTLEQLAGRESLASVGEFAAGLAHEVRNPLTAVQIDLQFVESQLPPDSPLLEPQAKAIAEIRRLDSTVRDALRVARSGRIKALAIDLRVPLRAAVEAARPVLAERGAILAVDLPPTESRMVGDPDALEQLFLNLLLNAAQALDGGGCVGVELSKDEDDFCVAIRDEGVGMSDEVRERAFEPLFSTHGRGTGLGLPISRRIVVAHGGEVRVESVQGEGTTIEVVLPRGWTRAGLRVGDRP